MIDLHTHTNASDGALPRRDVLEFAALCGAQTIAITDHDTMKNSYDDPDSPVRVLAGLEMSSCDPSTGRKVHILCYLPRRTDELEAFCRTMQMRRFDRGESYFAELSELFPIITRERLAQYAGEAGAYFKQHFLNVLIDYGYTDEVYGELYKKLFSSGLLKTPGEPEYYSVFDVIDIAHAAGGVAVLAHPSVYHTMELAQTLARQHLVDGLEVYHYRNRPEDREILLALASENGLIVTGGSDYHARTNNGPVLIGGGETAPDQLQKIIELSASRR